MLVAIQDAVKAQDKLAREIDHAPEPVRAVVKAPLEGAMEAAINFGDILLGDSTDENRTDRGGTVIWLHAEPSWEKIEAIWIPHIWGESAKHYQILLDLCEWGVANGYGDYPVKYAITDHPLNNIATQFFVTPRQVVKGIATTTMRQALALGRLNEKVP